MPLSSSGERPLSSWQRRHSRPYTDSPRDTLDASKACRAGTNLRPESHLATACASSSSRSATTLHMSDFWPFLGPDGIVTSAQGRSFLRKFCMLSTTYFAE